jgi:hypothetical protein
MSIKKGVEFMEENKIAVEETKDGINWAGVIVGLFLGAFLFWLTIQAITLLMFSRTAA